MIKPWFVSIALCAGFVPQYVLADQYGPSWKPEFGREVGLTFGSGDVISPGVTGEPALTPSNVSLYSGDTLYMQWYYRQAIGHTGLSLKAAMGFGLGCMVPTCLDLLGNGPYQFTTITGDLALEYAWRGGRVGIGRTSRYLNAVTSTSSVYDFDEADMRTVHGWFLEYEWQQLGLRYTHVIYRSRVSATSVNGSNFGIYLHENYRDEDWYPGGRYFDQGMGYARQEMALVLHPTQWSF
jgi:hypothetical protein